MGPIPTRSARVLPAVFLFAQVLAIVAGCSEGTRNETRADALAPAAFDEALRQDPDAVLIDVRTPREYAAERIGDPKLIDYHSRSFRDEVDRLDRDRSYLIYCRTGSRSGHALAIFRALGFRDVRHLDGGISAWKKAGLPTRRRDSNP